MKNSNAHTLKKPITFNALVQRLKRRAARDGETFHINRDHVNHNRDLGYWYTTSGGWVTCAWHSLDSLVEYARSINALAAYEEVRS